MTATRALRALVVALAAGAALPAAAQGQSVPVPAAPVPTRVIGGKPVPIAERPWQVAVLRGGRQICGGALVAPNWVLTAAHCLQVPVTRTAGYEILEGTDDLSQGGKHRSVDRAVLNPRWEEESFSNDIALLHLAVPAGSAVLALGSAEDIAAALREQRWAVVTGWGLRRALRQQGADGRLVDATTGQPVDDAAFRRDYATQRLMEVELPLVPVETCRGAYGGRVGAQQICAGLPEGGADSCQGDSGGPLIVRGAGGGWVQVGVVSWGAGCGVAGQYGVYTLVPAYRDWLRKVIGTAEACAAPATPAAARDLIFGGGAGGVSVEILPVLGRRVAAAPAAALRPGQSVAFRVTTRRAGYLSLFDVQPDGRLTRLFPNAVTQPARKAPLAAGRTVLIPDPADPYDRARFAMPAGSGSILAVVTDQPLPEERDLVIVPSPEAGAEAAPPEAGAEASPPETGAAAAPPESGAQVQAPAADDGLAALARRLRSAFGDCGGKPGGWAAAARAYVIPP